MHTCWVNYLPLIGFSYYYQHDSARLSACPLVIHALLHIGDGIRMAGPVWVYWCFLMERYCGMVQRSVASRLYPYASLNRRILALEQLKTIENKYDLQDRLAAYKRGNKLNPNSVRLSNCEFQLHFLRQVA